MSLGGAEKDDWVKRVLGVTWPVPVDGAAAGATSVPTWRVARQAWQDANDSVNEQINGLRTALLDRAKGGDDGMDGLVEALSEIADKGLNAITENHRVKLMAAVMELGGGDPATLRKSGPKALGLISEFQTFLDGSEKIEVCDANPFGAAVSIRATLSPALQQMIAALQVATPRA